MPQEKNELREILRNLIIGRQEKGSIGDFETQLEKLKIDQTETAIREYFRVREIMGYSLKEIKKAMNWCKQHGFDIQNDPEQLKKPFINKERLR